MRIDKKEESEEDADGDWSCHLSLSLGAWPQQMWEEVRSHVVGAQLELYPILNDDDDGGGNSY